MKSLVLYHASCADGFTAAWAAWLVFGDTGADYKSMQYGKGPPELIKETGDAMMYENIYVLDFSFPASDLKALTHHAQGNVILIDHHKTAQADLAPLMKDPHPKIVLFFDMDKSGAMLAWEHFHPGIDPPMLVQYVQDRDLWTWKLPGTAPAMEYLSTLPFSFEKWEDIDLQLTDDRDWVINQGEAMLRYRDAHVERVTKKPGFCRLEGYLVPCINAPQWQSEIGAKLSLDHPFAVMWFMNYEGGFIYSLRSNKDYPKHVDVSAIAKIYGGGGHKHAAGFRSNAPPMMVVGPTKESA